MNQEIKQAIIKHANAILELCQGDIYECEDCPNRKNCATGLVYEWVAIEEDDIQE